MTMRPDPTFHASPKLAMEAPPEEFAYTLLLSPDFSKPDALAVIDVKPGSATYSQIVHTVTMPYKGDEFHHFGWNACSSSLSPLAGHTFLERRYLIIPGIRSSRIYVVDTKPHPTQAKIHKTIEPEEVFKKTGYSRPHTVHCGPEGIYVSTLGGGGKDGAEGPPGVFIMDCETFDVLGRWEIDRGPQKLHYDFWWNLPRDYMVSSEWGLPPQYENGAVPEDLLSNKYGHHVHFWDLRARAMCRPLILGPITRWCWRSAPRMIPCASTVFWPSSSTLPTWKARFGPGGAKAASSTLRRRRPFPQSLRPRISCRPCCRVLAQYRRL
jgi:methanethiol oxidase